ncbi:MAG: hypothetical protein COA58_05280 [Bacteroidetes bacterium]|nr:MAG: hypothetical protein COA58_05280 [Bacteroidota bacterium]
MKKAFYFLLIPFAVINLNLFCPVFYQHLEGYADIPSGPITLQELHDFNPNNVRDLKGNGMPFVSFSSMEFLVKKQFDSTFSHIGYLNGRDEQGIVQLLDSMSKELTIGDSVLIDLNFYKPNRRTPSEFLYYFGNYYESKQIYVVKTETIASLMRKGNSFISTYPNPASQEFTLQCEVPEQIEASYFILDQMGRKVQENHISDIRQATKIKLEGYTPGAYLLYLVIDGEFFTKKIIKT